MPELLQALQRAWHRSDALFALLPETAWRERPIPLRQPFVFYLGHLPAFAWNQVCGGLLGEPGFRSEFDALFERGIDPLDASGVPPEPHWPELHEIRAYRDEVRRRLLAAAPRVAHRAPQDELAEGQTIYHVVLEHELMHHETLLYMLAERVWDAPPAGVAPPVTGPGVAGLPVAVPAGRAELGGHRDRQPFGWDNEFPVQSVEVDAFRIDSHPVTNARLLQFVRAGGYADDALWSEAGRAWRDSMPLRWPHRWRVADGDAARDASAGGPLASGARASGPLAHGDHASGAHAGGAHTGGALVAGAQAGATDPDGRAADGARADSRRTGDRRAGGRRAGGAQARGARAGGAQAPGAAGGAPAGGAAAASVAAELEFVVRGPFGELPFEAVAGWPAQVSQAEAEAFAAWAGGRLPSEAELHRAAYGSPDGSEREFPWGSAAPDARRCNANFVHWSPLPVGQLLAGESAFGIAELVGNGWELTSTPFRPLPGFEPTVRTYPGYSTDFFDDQHMVVFGGSWATDARLLRKSFRNWYQPHYPYVFSKFRVVYPT